MRKKGEHNMSKRKLEKEWCEWDREKPNNPKKKT
jgi:hypothetical protein